MQPDAQPHGLSIQNTNIDIQQRPISDQVKETCHSKYFSQKMAYLYRRTYRENSPPACHQNRGEKLRYSSCRWGLPRQDTSVYYLFSCSSSCLRSCCGEHGRHQEIDIQYAPTARARRECMAARKCFSCWQEQWYLFVSETIRRT